LLVRRRGRMNRQGLGVTHVGQMRYQLQGIDEFLPRLGSALDAKTDDRPGALGQIFIGPCFFGACGKSRLVYPTHERMLFQIAGDSQRVLGMPDHP
jgi:hypothetical protein